MTIPIHSVNHVKNTYRKHQIVAASFAVITLVATILAAVSGLQLAHLRKQQQAQIDSAQTSTQPEKAEISQQAMVPNADLDAEKATSQALREKITELEKKLSAATTQLSKNNQKKVPKPAQQAKPASVTQPAPVPKPKATIPKTVSVPVVKPTVEPKTETQPVPTSKPAEKIAPPAPEKESRPLAPESADKVSSPVTQPAVKPAPQQNTAPAPVPQPVQPAKPAPTTTAPADAKDQQPSTESLQPEVPSPESTSVPQTPSEETKVYKIGESAPQTTPEPQNKKAKPLSEETLAPKNDDANKAKGNQ